MATPTSFDESNTYLGPPPGVNDEACGNLSIVRIINGENACVVSCHKIESQEELDEIIRTKRIWIMHWGLSIPPVWVGGIKPDMSKRLTAPDENGNLTLEK